MTWLCGMHLRTQYLVASLVTYVGLSRGVLVNRTIDDQFGDSITGILPTYESPSVDGWKQGSVCTDCDARPEPGLAFKGTWHDSTWHPGDPGENIVSVGFTGSAVYVFVILANNIPYVTSFTSLSFSLDGEVVGTFVQPPASSTDYEYNVAAYTNENLVNTLHNLTMQTTGNNESLFLFDYLVYSTDDEVTSAAPTSQTGPPTLPQSMASVPALSKSADSNPSTTPPHGSISPHGGRNTSVLAGGLTGGLIAAAFVTGLILYGYRRRIRSILMNQKFSETERSVRPSTGFPTSSGPGGTTTGIWSSSPTPASNVTYKGGPTYDDSCNFSQAVITPSTEQSGGNMATYAQTTTEAASEIQIAGVPTYKPGSQAPPKSAEQQLQLFRQIERIWQQYIPTTSRTASDLSSRQIQRGLNLGTSEAVDEAGILRERAVLLLDDIEHLNARASAGAGDIGDELPPDYSSEGLRSPVSYHIE